jgi:hypothetical protein
VRGDRHLEGANTVVAAAPHGLGGEQVFQHALREPYDIDRLAERTRGGLHGRPIVGHRPMAAFFRASDHDGRGALLVDHDPAVATAELRHEAHRKIAAEIERRPDAAGEPDHSMAARIMDVRPAGVRRRGRFDDADDPCRGAAEPAHEIEGVRPDIGDATATADHTHRP